MSAGQNGVLQVVWPDLKTIEITHPKGGQA